MVQRFEQKIEQRLVAMTDRCQKQKRDPMKVAREIGCLLGQNTRAAKLFDVTVEKPQTATLVSSGRRSKRFVTGPHSALAATFFAPTSLTGATKSCGKRTSN